MEPFKLENIGAGAGARSSEKQQPAASIRDSRRVSVEQLSAGDFEKTQGAVASLSQGHPIRSADKNPKPENPIHRAIRLAETVREHFLAFRLVYEKYEAFGYIQPHKNRTHMTPWNLTDRSHTFVNIEAGRCTGTATAIEDGPAGVPADATYPKALRALRKQGGHFIEVSSFATADGHENGGLALALIRTIVIYSQSVLRATDWVCIVHPRHIRFYKKILLFEELAGVAPCASANGAPGVLLRLNLRTLEPRFLTCYGHRRGSKNLHRFFFEPVAARYTGTELGAAFQRRKADFSRKVQLAFP